MTKGERIRWLRNRKKLSLEAVGKVAGVSRQTMCRYESGEIEAIPEETLKKIASVLDTSPSYIMGWTDDPLPARPADGTQEFNPRMSELGEDMRVLARAGTKLSPEQLAVIRKYAEFMYPEAFRDD